MVGDDVTDITTTIGNSLFPAGTVTVGNNGGLGFNLDPVDKVLTAENFSIFDPTVGNRAFRGAQAVVPFWDDIDNEVGDVYWNEMTYPWPDMSGNVLVIQWNDHPFAGSSDTSRFQIQIFDTPGPDSVFCRLVYDDIEQARPNGGGSATIGYQNPSRHYSSVEWSFNTPGSVSNGMVLSLVPEPGTGALLVAGGLVLLASRRKTG